MNSELVHWEYTDKEFSIHKYDYYLVKSIERKPDLLKIAGFYKTKYVNGKNQFTIQINQNILKNMGCEANLKIDRSLAMILDGPKIYALDDEQYGDIIQKQCVKL